MNNNKFQPIYLFVIAILLFGWIGSWYYAQTIAQESQQQWQQQVDRKITQIMQQTIDRIERYRLMLKSMDVLYRGSQSVSSAEFLDGVSAIENTEQAAIEFVINHFIHQDNRWYRDASSAGITASIYSWEFIDNTAIPNDVIDHALEQERAILHVTTTQPVHAYLLQSVMATGSGGILVSEIPLQSLMDGLLAIHADNQIAVDVSVDQWYGKYTGRITSGTLSSSNALTMDTRITRFDQEWLFHWSIADTYLGGADQSNASWVFWSGGTLSSLLATLLLVLIVDAQRQRRTAIERHALVRLLEKQHLELIETNTSLETRVQERTQSLQRAIDEMQSFSYAISHDLKKPLRHLSAFVSMLKDEIPAPLTHEQDRLLNSMNLTLNSAQKLIEGLLEFAKIGHTALRLQPESIDSLVKEVCSEYEEQSIIKFSTNSDDPIMMTVDKLLIKQLVRNLIDNAIKFTRQQPHPKVDVNLITSEFGVQMIVRDNGVGFDDAHRDKLFGLFQRLHDIRDFPGTGIGLALCAKIAQLHGGQINAHGVVGQGAEFVVDFPY